MVLDGCRCRHTALSVSTGNCNDQFSYVESISVREVCFDDKYDTKHGCLSLCQTRPVCCLMKTCQNCSAVQTS
jgi:hypothetical protein